MPEAKGKKRLLKGKKTERDKEINASLQAMMDSDDGQFVLGRFVFVLCDS